MDPPRRGQTNTLATRREEDEEKEEEGGGAAGTKACLPRISPTAALAAAAEAAR